MSTNDLINEKYGESFKKHLLEQYKLYVDTSLDITSKRLESNKFYLAINSGVFGLTAYITTQVNSIIIFLFSLIGALASIIWLANIYEYRELNRAKFKVIHELETRLPASLFKTEEKYYFGKYHGLTSIEIFCPFAFIILYSALVILTLGSII